VPQNGRSGAASRGPVVAERLLREPRWLQRAILPDLGQVLAPADNYWVSLGLFCYRTTPDDDTETWEYVRGTAVESVRAARVVTYNQTLRRPPQPQYRINGCVTMHTLSSSSVHNMQQKSGRLKGSWRSCSRRSKGTRY